MPAVEAESSAGVRVGRGWGLKVFVAVGIVMGLGMGSVV